MGQIMSSQNSQLTKIGSSCIENIHRGIYGLIYRTKVISHQTRTERDDWVFQRIKYLYYHFQQR
jgi:hypothetical protein